VCFCVFFLTRTSLFILWLWCDFCVFALVCFVLSVAVPVQVIAWKDSSPSGT